MQVIRPQEDNYVVYDLHKRKETRVVSEGVWKREEMCSAERSRSAIHL